MRPITLIRTLGVLSICVSAISFLIEGWENFNGLEKYLSFFGFTVCLFLLAELFRRSSESLSIIFSSLFVILSPAIMAQLGSFVIEPGRNIDFPQLFSPSPLPDGSPVKFICIVSILLVYSMLIRVLKTLQSRDPIADFAYFLLSGLMFLIPERSSLFHAITLLGIFFAFSYSNSKGIYKNQHFSISSLIRLSPFFLLFGRAVLYKTDSSLYIVIWFIVSLLFFNLSVQDFGQRIQKEFSQFAGYISVLFMAHEISSLLKLDDYLWSIVIVELLLVIYLIIFKQSSKFAVYFMSFFAWYAFLRMLVVEKDDVNALLMTVQFAIPLTVIIFSFMTKTAFGVFTSVPLFIVMMVYFTYRLVEFPAMNSWMVFGGVGVLLLILSFVVEKPHQKVKDLWETLKKSLDGM